MSLFTKIFPVEVYGFFVETKKETKKAGIPFCFLSKLYSINIMLSF